MTFSEAKKDLLAKKQEFEDIGNEYILNNNKRDEFSKARENFDKALDNYELTLQQLSEEEYDKEYKEALSYNEFASKEYDPFIPAEAIQPGQDVPETPFNPLAVASDRRDLAKKWTGIMSKNYARYE